MCKASMRPALPSLIGGLILAGWVVQSSAQSTSGADSEKNLIDWYYAAFFGTGVYRSNDRTVSVLQIPFSGAIQPADADHVGLRFTLPISFGCIRSLPPRFS